MSVIEVAQVVSAIAGSVSAVGAVGTASLGVRALVKGVRAARASGLSVRDSFASARSGQAQADHDSQGGADWVENPHFRG